MTKKIYALLILLPLVLMVPGILFAKGAYQYRYPDQQVGIDPSAHTVIGTFTEHLIADKETLLDIARNFDLGYLDMILLHPNIDAWLPPAGEKITTPTTWILPDINKDAKGIIINIPELRLYYFLNDIKMVKTYPIGLGVLDSPTPFGSFSVIEKTKDPTWNIPSSLQEKYGRTSIPPGPDNPLGEYRLRLSNPDYGIHGTNSPWGVGRLVSHGCIRLYPEDIEDLFSLVNVGTPVEIIYEPVKIGFQEGRIFVEVHPDLYNKVSDLLIYTARKLFIYQIWEEVDLDLLVQALEEHKGIPIDITRKK
ncbi:MAG: L,D-transpeptidase family protein [Deltaproteobacteria bacterium]|nr:L,D-transpeptidase family protein [Deltaproteobacteria bacterium]